MIEFAIAFYTDNLAQVFALSQECLIVDIITKHRVTAFTPRSQGPLSIELEILFSQWLFLLLLRLAGIITLNCTAFDNHFKTALLDRVYAIQQSTINAKRFWTRGMYLTRSISVKNNFKRNSANCVCVFVANFLPLTTEKKKNPPEPCNSKPQ